ncbi:ABC transporter ATP-binding protein [Actinomyces sp. F1_1611]
MIAPKALAVTNLSMSFGKHPVLTDVTFTLERDHSMAITGPSGSGKTTLLSIIMGLIRPTSGTTTVDGTIIQDLNRRQLATLRGSKIGVVFQHSELIESMTALENVILPALIRNDKDETALERGRELLDAVKVPDRDTLAADLSGGERQRTAVARALINSPALILADEPTGALDTELRDSIAEMLFALPATQNCALVVVTHDPSLAARANHQHRLPSRFESGSLTKVGETPDQ